MPRGHFKLYRIKNGLKWAAINADSPEAACGDNNVLTVIIKWHIISVIFSFPTFSPRLV